MTETIEERIKREVVNAWIDKYNSEKKYLQINALTEGEKFVMNLTISKTASEIFKRIEDIFWVREFESYKELKKEFLGDGK